MIIKEMIQDARRELNMAVGDKQIADDELAAFLNRGQDIMASKVIEADMNFFEESDATIGFVAEQEEYNLPEEVRNQRISRISRIDLVTPKPLTRIRFQEKDQYSSTSILVAGGDTNAGVYYLRGQRIGLKPTPKITLTANLLINYIRLPAELHWAEAESLTANTLIQPTEKAPDDPSPVLLAGRASSEPTYYVGTRLRFITLDKKSYGSTHEITAWDVATRKITFTPAVDLSDVSYGEFLEYCILTPIPDEYHQGMYAYMMMQAADKLGDAARFKMAEKAFKVVMDNLDNTIEPRVFDENLHVRPPVDQHFD